MKYRKDNPSHPRVAEPVQVYLKPSDQDRLSRLTEELGTTKSGVLRQGLEALERQLTDPREHPLLRVIGLGASADGGAGPDYDPAREHDRFAAESEIDAWEASPRSGDD